MKENLIKNKIETLLKQYKIPYLIQQEKKLPLFRIVLFPNKSEEEATYSIFVEYQKGYLILHLLGWEILEKIEEEDFYKEENFLQRNIFQILSGFLKGNIKLKIIYREEKACVWQLFILTEAGWVFYQQYRKFFLCFLGNYKSVEWNINSFVN